MTISAPHDVDATVRIGMLAVVRTDTILAVLDAATILGAKQVLGIHNNNWLVHFMLYIMIRHISRYVHRH